MIGLMLAAAVLSRAPDRARYLLSWDAASFALATESYNVSALRPHAPGYPLYVAVGTLVRHVIPDANAALVTVSLVATAIAVVLLFWLGASMHSRAVGSAAAILLAVDPVAYVHSVTANSYSAEMACSLAVGVAAWHARLHPTPFRVAVLGLLMATSAGVRPPLILFLGPLALWGAIPRSGELRDLAPRLAPGLIVAVVISCTWFVPMVQLSGGIDAWLLANQVQGEVIFSHPFWRDGWFALGDHLSRLGLYFTWELWILVPILLAVILVAMVRGGPPHKSLGLSAPEAAFIAWWVSPALLFYLLVSDGHDQAPSGYILVILPALLLAAVMVVAQALPAINRSRRSLAMLGIAVLAAGATPLYFHRHGVVDVLYAEHDAWSEGWAALPQAFPPTNTSIVTIWQFAYAAWSFPEYTVYEYRPPAPEPGDQPDFLLIQVAREHAITPDWYPTIANHETGGPHPLPDGTAHLVLCDFQLAGENGGPRRLRADLEARAVLLPNGWRVLVVDTVPGRTALEDYFDVNASPLGDRAEIEAKPIT